MVSSGSTGNYISENSIYDNTGLRIDLGEDGSEANDSGDGDTGPNHPQNYPTNITFANRDDVALAKLTLDATANCNYILDIYSCDSSVSGEGRACLARKGVQPSQTGMRTFSANSVAGQVHQVTTTTATHLTAATTDAGTIA